MTKPVITTRAGKGSALTWTEGDTNLTNLRDATVTLKAGTGGTDVVTDLNGTTTIVAGTGITVSGDNTAKTITVNANLALDDLNNVLATSPSSGDILVWNNASSVWQAQQPSGGSLALDDLTDVNVMGASNGQVLAYNNSLVRWEAVTISTGIASVVDDTTPQLGGNLDVAGHSIVSASNGNIAITPNGTGSIVLDGLNWPQVDGTSNQVLKTNGAGQLSWTTITSGISTVSADTTPSLGGNLDVAGNSIISTSNGNIAITPNGTGSVVLDGLNWPQTDGTSNQVLKTNGSGQLSWTTMTSGIASVSADTTPTLGGHLNVNGYELKSTSVSYDLTLSSLGTYYIQYKAIGHKFGTGANDATLTSNGAYNLYLNTNDGGTSGQIVIYAGANGNITLVPNGTGKVKVTSLNYNEGAIYDLGTTGGTIAPNVANGNVQKITLNSALTMNAFTSPVAGQSLTLIIYGGTAYTSITSTMKFAGGVKTLTGTASCIDILTVYYDGTNYFASLGKGFA